MSYVIVEMTPSDKLTEDLLRRGFGISDLLRQELRRLHLRYNFELLANVNPKLAQATVVGPSFYVKLSAVGIDIPLPTLCPLMVKVVSQAIINSNLNFKHGALVRWEGQNQYWSMVAGGEVVRSDIEELLPALRS